MSSEEYVIVNTSYGAIRGKKKISCHGNSYLSFQGIPYGRPPINELRFKAPLAVEPWTGVRDTLAEGPVAPSLDLLTGDTLQNASEDCLYLNVYTPKLCRSEKAVMFWIHGGGFNAGSGNADLYGPDYLISRDVVIVTCNYRLGVLGFLSLQTTECPGNNGLKDIILALKWCRSEISKFGGDPENITIFGESAGGAAVNYLVLSKKTNELFDKAIAQSGVALNPWAYSRKPREAAYKLAEVLGCTAGSDEELLRFLRTVRPQRLVTSGLKILKAIEPNEHFAENAFLPCIEPDAEDAVITMHPDEVYKSGQMRKLPFMLGANTLEGLIMIKGKRNLPSDESSVTFNVEDLIPKNLNVQRGSEEAKEIRERISQFYFPRGFNERHFIDVLSQIYFLNGINQVIRYHREFSNVHHPTFVYRFTYNGDALGLKHLLGYGRWKGTCHGDELVYLFKQQLTNIDIMPGTRDYSTMRVMTAIWTNFAKTGTPMIGNSWLPISADNCPYMEIDEDLTQQDLDKEDLEKSHFEFWRDVQEVALQRQSNCKL